MQDVAARCLATLQITRQVRYFGVGVGDGLYYATFSNYQTSSPLGLKGVPETPATHNPPVSCAISVMTFSSSWTCYFSSRQRLQQTIKDSPSW